MAGDKGGWVKPATRVFTVTRADKRCSELSHFEMEMRPVFPICRPDRGDLFASPHVLPRLHQNGVDVSVIRLHEFARALFFIGVQHNDNVAPARTSIPRQQDPAIGDRVDRITQVAVLAADSV